MDYHVSVKMNQQLLFEFTALKVDAALGQRGPLKSLGLDGYAACFFQKSWPVVGPEVCQVVLQFLNNVIFKSTINHTYIALIPKKWKPGCVTEFRPIS